MNGDAIEIVRDLADHGARIEGLESWRTKHEERQNGSLEKIWTELDALRREFAGRPTWAVTLVLAILSNLVVALATFAFTRR